MANNHQPRHESNECVSSVFVWVGQSSRAKPGHFWKAPKFRDIVEEFRIHRENKSRAPDGNPCDFQTRGLLKRTHIEAAGVIAHGKETARQWQKGEDISLLFPELPVYRPNETARKAQDPVLAKKVRQMSIRALARKTGFSTRTIRAARNGKRLRKSTILKLEKALSDT